MGFPDRIKYHDNVLHEILPQAFDECGMDFAPRGYEKELARDGLIISQLEDETSTYLRFTPDGQAVLKYHNTYLIELKTILPEQESLNYDFEMAPWEKAISLHKTGALVTYIFFPANKVAWVMDTKPDFIIVPNWRWRQQDYLRIKNRYESMCPVHYKVTSTRGSGTIFGVIHKNRIDAMLSFDKFWKEETGKWLKPKQLNLPLNR